MTVDPPAPRTASPTCYAAIRDAAIRNDVAAELGKLGWRVVDRPTGYHLVEALADVILEDHPNPAIDLVVVEEPSPGCRGSSLARGLRDLGIDVPVAVIADPGAVSSIDPGDQIYVVEPERAAVAISAIAAARRD